MNPYDKAHELARAIKSSDAYERLVKARAHIEQDESSLRMLQDFRQRQFAMQTQEMMGQPVSEEDKDKLTKLAEVIQLNQDVRTYLESEYQLSVLMSDIQRILGDAIEDALLPLPGQSEQIAE